MSAPRQPARPDPEDLMDEDEGEEIEELEEELEDVKSSYRQALVAFQTHFNNHFGSAESPDESIEIYNMRRALEDLIHD